MRNFHQAVQDRITQYKPQGGLDVTSKLFLHMAAVRHPDVRDHCERVGLLAEAVAIKLDKDPKAAFFGGLLHDIGKAVLPAVLFDGHNISAEEYALVKEHAYDGFNILKDMHLFTALICGAHHAMYTAGYGASQEDFPKEWGLATVKKALEIATIVSICDFIDAFTHRTTTLKDGSAGPDLPSMLEKKYPNDLQVVRTALKCAKVPVNPPGDKP
jgi:putative nucleotidyltransferase with HDIG domain